jgi:hypothetical protein
VEATPTELAVFSRLSCGIGLPNDLKISDWSRLVAADLRLVFFTALKAFSWFVREANGFSETLPVACPAEEARATLADAAGASMVGLPPIRRYSRH